MLRLSPNVIYDTDNESKKKYLMDIENGNLYFLNDTASILIEHIIEGKSVDDYISTIESLIKDDEKIEIETIRNDVDIYINLLIDQGYILKEG